MMFRLNFLSLVTFFSFVLTSCQFSNLEKAFHPNGNLHYKVPLLNENRHGTLEQYYLDGSLQLTSNWENGVKHGSTTSYYKNGQVKSLEFSVNGEANGRFEYYDSLGRIHEVINYSNDREHGPYYKYFSDSTLNVIANFNNGKRDGRVTVYDSSGFISRRMVYDDGEIKYSVDYTEKAAFFKPYMNIDISRINKNKVNIKLEYSFYDSVRIGVIIGPLGKNGELLDTLAVLGSKVGNKSVSYDYVGENLSGVLFEMDYSADNNGRIMSQYPFYMNN